MELLLCVTFPCNVNVITTINSYAQDTTTLRRNVFLVGIHRLIEQYDFPFPPHRCYNIQVALWSLQQQKIVSGILYCELFD